jgi:PAS domain S-box-containing protein
MTLKNKSLIIVGATFLCLILCILTIAWFVLYDNLEKTEAHLVRQDIMRGLIILQNELTLLSTLTGDYAGWDDTYAFVRDGNKAYIESNLVESTFSKQRLNLLLIINNGGRIVYGTGFHLKNNQKTSIPQAMQDYLYSGSPLLSHRDTESAQTGLINLPDGPLMFASRPILTSDYRGPIRGTLIMGRFLDSSESDHLASLTRLDLHYQFLKHEEFPKKNTKLVPFTIGNAPITLHPLSREIIQGSTTIQDICGRPILTMTVKVPRFFFKQEERTLVFMVISVFMTVLIFGSIFFFLLEKMVLSRLQKISDEVNRIGASGNSLMRISVSGNDELSGLARNINGMIDTIAESWDAIQTESDRYRAVVEDQSEFICRFGLQGKLIFANEALGRYLDVPPDNLMGRTFYEVFPWENDDEIRQELAGIDGNCSVKNFEAKMIFPGEMVRWSQWTIRAIIADHGLIKEYQTVGSDITERVHAESEKKALEERFFQAQKMEAIGTLAGGIAHDFNNILMGIAGYVSLMLYDIGEDHPHYKKLKAIEQQVKSAASLTRDLLGFARGGMYEVIPTDLNQILERTDLIFGRTRKEIEICHRFEENLWTVKVDRSQMEQVFLNLFVNASQAMPAGGNLYLETKNVNVSENQGGFMKIPPGPYVQVSVTDEGVGMDEETKERIFEPFFTTKDREKRGSGLGLASVYGIVKNHGGMIHVYTEKGVGTTFRIYIPAGNPVEILQEESDRGTQNVLRGTEGIMVVEDEELLLEVTVKILDFLGYRIFTARSGAEALETYLHNRDKIDLVMLDMIMPGMSGEETFRQLKEIHPDVKVILASGYSLNEQATKIMENGCRAFLQKPYNTGELSRTVRGVLDQLF